MFTIILVKRLQFVYKYNCNEMYDVAYGNVIITQLY